MTINLAQAPIQDQGKLVSFPKKESTVTSVRQEGFSPLPNFLTDDRYFAELPPGAAVALVVLNRHLNHKHSKVKAFTITLAQELCGFKDERTASKHLKVLVDWRLVKAIKSNGKASLYELDFTDPKPTNYLLNKQPPTKNEGGLKAPTLNAPPPKNEGTPPPNFVGTPPPKNGGLIKNINKELNKEKKERGISAEKLEEELFSEYLAENTDPISLKLLSRKQVSLPTDLRAQAKKINPELCDDLITAEIKGFAQWSLTRNPVTPQTWMNYWIHRIQNLKGSNSRGLKPKTESKQHQAKKFTGLSDSQCNVFASKICADDNFGSQYAEIGETQKQFVSRITEKLKDPAQVLEWADYLRAVGFEGNLGEQA